MITAGERHELKTEVNRLNTHLRIILQNHNHTGDMIPISPDCAVLKNEYFKELLAKRQMLWKVLSIFNLRFEEDFKLLPLNF